MTDRRFIQLLAGHASKDVFNEAAWFTCNVMALGAFPDIEGMSGEFISSPGFHTEHKPVQYVSYLPNIVCAAPLICDMFDNLRGARGSPHGMGAAMMNTMHLLKAAYESNHRGVVIMTTEHKIFNEKPCDLLAFKTLTTGYLIMNAFANSSFTKEMLAKCIVCQLHFRDSGRDAFVLFPKDAKFFGEFYDHANDLVTYKFKNWADEVQDTCEYPAYRKHRVIKMDDLKQDETFVGKGCCKALYAYALDICATCQGPMPSRQFCGVCRRARYCGKECQRAAWKDHHRAICPHLKALGN